MLEKFLSLILCFIIIFSFCSCALTEKGNSLYAFCKRISKLDDSYTITVSGFIADEEKQTLTKFFTFDEKEFMLQFIMNEENDITTLHIVFDNINQNNSKELNFIKNCISSFIANEETSEAIFTEIDIDNCLYTVNFNSRKTKIGNIEIIIDVTEIGTVISVFQNIP